jgi:hypothetical protein
MVLAVLAVLASGCGRQPSTRDPIVGTWTAVLSAGERVPTRTATVTFSPDGTFVIAVLDGQGRDTLKGDKSGSWSFDRKSGQYTIERTGAGLAFHFELRGDELVPVGIGSGTQVTWHRKR